MIIDWFLGKEWKFGVEKILNWDVELGNGGNLYL